MLTDYAFDLSCSVLLMADLTRHRFVGADLKEAIVVLD